MDRIDRPSVTSLYDRFNPPSIIYDIPEDVQGPPRMSNGWHSKRHATRWSALADGHSDRRSPVSTDSWDAESRTTAPSGGQSGRLAIRMVVRHAVCQGRPPGRMAVRRRTTITDVRTHPTDVFRTRFSRKTSKVTSLN
jgi:hypothetical protein